MWKNEYEKDGLSQHLHYDNCVQYVKFDATKYIIIIKCTRWFSITSIYRVIIISSFHYCVFFLYGRRSCDTPMFLTFYIECKCNLTVSLTFYLEHKRNRGEFKQRKTFFPFQVVTLSRFTERGARSQQFLKSMDPIACRTIGAATYIGGAEVDLSASKGHPRRQLRVLVSLL